MKIGSFDTSVVTSKITDAVTSLTEAPVVPEAKLESVGSSDYEQVKDFAKLGAEKLDAAVQNLPTFRILQGVGALFGNTKSTGVEGGTDVGIPNSTNPDEVVDLADKEKFHATWGQKDTTESTASDGGRCQSNMMIAGLLMKGGPDEVKKGLTSAKDLATQQLATETDPNRKKALETAVKNLDTAINNIGAKTVTRGQMNHAADALFTLLTPAKDNAGKPQFEADGRVIGGLAGAEKSKIRDMEKLLGLTNGGDPKLVGEAMFAPATEDNREVSDNVWKTIAPGKSAHVGVNMYGEHVATGKDPWGNALKVDRNKKPYFDERVKNPNWNPADNASQEFLIKRRYVLDHAQHAVLMGRNADGTRYIYNPMGEPPYMTEKPGDKASSDAIDKMSTSLMGVKKEKDSSSNDWEAEVTGY